MELFFMLTAMLALIGPIVAGRVRCILMTPRHLFKRMLSSMPLDQRSPEAGALAWPHEVLSGKPDWCPKHAWATRTTVIRNGQSTTLSTFVRVTAALARVDHIAPNYASCPRYS